MKILIVLALGVVAVSAFDLRSKKIFTNPADIIAPFNEIGGRIANGQDATEGMFPHQVGLELEGTSTSSWCGGSLISDKFVLTAAHCTERAIRAIVHLGATIRTSPEITHIVESSKILIHEDRDSSTLMHDISLIEIPATKLSAKIQIIKIPALSSSFLEYTDEEAIVSGWGRMGDSGSMASWLQWGQVKIIENSVCADSYGSIIDATKMCIETPDRVSSCRGDSGGPLALKSSGIQVGLISFGTSRGCAAGYPVAFTRLSKYLEWIKEKTGVSY